MEEETNREDYIFKGSRKDDGGVKSGGGGAEGGKGATTDKQLKTRAVLFVEQSPGGKLSKQVRAKMLEIEPTLGFRLRVMERTGRNLLSNFPQTKTWSGSRGERSSQSVRGEV